MNIIQLNISEIKRNPNNPRVIKDDKFIKLVESIRSFPQMLRIRPIVVNSDGVVLGGNMRLKACTEAGLKEVPVIVADDLTEEQGIAAARVVGLTMLSTIRAQLGSLDRVKRVVKVLGMVNCTADFTTQPKVINGFSDLMVEVWGESGRAARSAVGMGSLPGNIPVEVEAILELND